MHVKYGEIHTKTDYTILTILQKKAICNVARVNYFDNTQPLCVEYKCLKFVDIVKVKTLMVVLRAKRGELPINLQQKMFI